MGTGTNVQKRLIAVHDLDIPWRPADLEQRAGRIIRQGNENKNVQIFRYVTKGTFDAYSYQTLENKQKFEKYGLSIDMVRYRIKIAKQKLKEYIILHENE